MQINETFTSLQGEGQTIGYPAHFIRTQGCNLRCPECDTKYSYIESGTSRSVEELAEGFTLSGVDTIVMTGGEPMLQWDEILKLFKILAVRRSPTPVLNRMIIETNGTICPLKEEFHQKMHFVVSPKFYSDTSYDLNVLGKFLTYGSRFLMFGADTVELKILFFEEHEILMAKQLLRYFRANNISVINPIIFQPGIPSTMPDREIPKLLVQAWDLYKQHMQDFPGSRFIVQQHKWMWGNLSRGV